MDETTTKTENETSHEPTDYTDIGLLEEPPCDDWFLERTDNEGRSLVYFRIRVTGMLPRIVGPFASREVALWCLDGLLSEVQEGLDCGACNIAQDHVLRRPFHRRVNPVLIEDPIAFGCPLDNPRPPKSRSKKPPTRKRKVA